MASAFSAASHFYYTSRNGLYLIITELSDINQSITETGTFIGMVKYYRIEKHAIREEDQHHHLL